MDDAEVTTVRDGHGRFAFFAPKCRRRGDAQVMLRPYVIPLLAIVACAPSAPARVAPQKLAPTKTSTGDGAKGPARWLRESPSEKFSPNIYADVLGGGTLQIDRFGDRWLGVGTPLRWKGAESALPEPVLAAAPFRTSFRFYGRSGQIYVAPGSLQRVTAAHHAPRTPRKVVFGDELTLLIGTDGTVHRSTDGGETWSMVTLVGEPAGMAQNAAIDRKGTSLVSDAFGRVWTSTDGAKTFTRLGRSLDQAGLPWFDRERRIRIEDKWILDGTPPKFVEAATPPPPDLSPERPPTRKRHDLDRVVVNADGLLEVKRSPEGWLMARHAADEKPEWRQAIELKNCEEVAAAATSKREYVACLSEEVPHTLSLFVTTDDGALELDGVIENAQLGSAIEAREDGWIAVHTNCAYAGEDCVPLHVRKPKAAEFVPVDLGVAASSIRFAKRFDGGPKIAVARVSDRSAVLVRFDDEGDATTTKLPEGTDASIEIDEQGRPVLWRRGDEHGTFFRILDDGRLEPLTTPVPAGTLSLAGARGLLDADKQGLFETSDGGRTFVRVATPFESNRPRCAPWGCFTDDAVRLGWDLAGEIAAAARPVEHTPPSFAPTGTPIRCTVTSWKTSAPKFENATVAPLGDTRLAWIDDTRPWSADLMMLRGDAVDVEKTTLLPQIAKNDAAIGRAEGARTVASGAFAWRLTWKRPEVKGAGIINPVSVELWWVHYRTGKVHHANLGEVGRFKVGSYDPGAIALLDDGIAYRAPATEPAELHVVRDNGKHEKLSVGPRGFGTSFALFAAGATRHVMTISPSSIGTETLGADDPQHVTFTFPSVGRWTSGYPGNTPELDLYSIGFRSQRPVFVVNSLHGDDLTIRTFVFAPSRGAEVEDVTELARPDAKTPACTAGTRNDTRYDVALGRRARRPLVIDDNGKHTMFAVDRVVAAANGAAVCVTAWVATEKNETRAIVFPGPSERSLWVRKGEIAVLSCSNAPELDTTKEPGWSQL